MEEFGVDCLSLVQDVVTDNAIPADAGEGAALGPGDAGFGRTVLVGGVTETEGSFGAGRAVARSGVAGADVATVTLFSESGGDDAVSAAGGSAKASCADLRGGALRSIGTGLEADAGDATACLALGIGFAGLAHVQEAASGAEGGGSTVLRSLVASFGGAVDAGIAAAGCVDSCD